MRKFETKTQLILYFLKGAKRYFVLSALCAAAVSLLDMLSPRIISYTVDTIVGADAGQTGLLASFFSPGFLEGGVRLVLTYASIAVLLTGGLAALFRYLFRACNARGSELFVERTRSRLFRHIMYLPYSWLGENSTGDIIQRCTSDVQTIKRFVSEQLTNLVRTFILIVMAVAFMASINWKVMLVSAAFIPIIVAYSLFFHSRIGSAFEKADIEEGNLSTIAQENLTGVRVVRAFGREDFERERFEKQNEYYTGFWVHLIGLMSAYWSSGDVLTGLQNLSVLTVGSVLCVQGKLTTGNLIALVSYNVMLTWPVRALGRVISEMSKAGISIERLRYIMNSEPEQDRENAITPPMDRDICFEHVTFSYENGGGKVLDDVSFTIKAGSTVGILGGTGSGKSTLMFLLERLYPLESRDSQRQAAEKQDTGKRGVGSQGTDSLSIDSQFTKGRITVGGVDIADIEALYLRKNVGIVLQEPYLFSRTLEENISFALEEGSVSLEEVREAAKIACIDDTILEFTDGYQTFVGERGMTLSGGQKQRTAIAQMIIRKAPVMIFDDSLSAVDAETDRQIRKQLQQQLKDSTVILISHRITTLMQADQILVLDKGRIVEQGTHKELIEKGGLYQRIYRLQSQDGSEEERKKAPGKGSEDGFGEKTEYDFEKGGDA